MKKNKDKVDKNKLKRIILLILIIIWAMLVFNLSNQVGEESSGLSRKVVSFFIKDEQKINIIEPYARKVAHFSEYGLGGILFLLMFNTFEWSENRRITCSILFGIWYASLDEIHQLMVPARSGRIVDIWIDCLGFSTGVFCTVILLRCIDKKKKSKKKIKRGAVSD